MLTRSCDAENSMFTPDESLLEQWVSTERLNRYRAADAPTTELYLWNAELSAAYFEIVGHAEVLLRNVFHSALAPHSVGGRWYQNSAYPFSAHAQRDIRSAIRRATRDQQFEYPGKVVAEFSFGFWRFLLGKRYKTTIWPLISPQLQGVPRHLRDRHQLEQVTTRINELRNRVAHHEPIFHQASNQHLSDIFLVARYVDIRAEQMLKGISRVEQVLLRRPSLRN